MWALVTELLFSLVLLAFLVISCQNVLHIASGSVRSVLTYVHKQLDRELGEAEGVADEEENVTTRVVRRRVILKVQRARTPARPGRHGRGRDFFSLFAAGASAEWDFSVSCGFVHEFACATGCSDRGSSSN